MSSRLAGAAVALVLCSTALAAGRTLSSKDLDTYGRLRDARALADQRIEGPGGAARRGQAEAGFQEALRSAGWTAARYEEVDSLVNDVGGYLQNARENPGEAEAYWEGNELVDAATVALVKARLPQLDGAGDRARKTLRDERESAVMGRLATKADLQGSWRRDPEASRAHLASAMHFSEAQVREVYKDVGDSSFTFTGDQVEGREFKGGAPVTWKIGYRLEGRDLVFIDRGREHRLQVGVKSPTELVFGMMGVPSGVYRKR
jgi:hypothetical protein